MRNIVICLFGSSIMEGRIGVDDPLDRWYNVFQRLLLRAHSDVCFPIVNSAVGGESTREVMSRFDRAILPYNPDICLFMVGGNNHDCQNPSRILVAGELHTLLASFVSRLPRKTKPVRVFFGSGSDRMPNTTVSLEDDERTKPRRRLRVTRCALHPKRLNADVGTGE